MLIVMFKLFVKIIDNKKQYFIKKQVAFIVINNKFNFKSKKKAATE
jgi:hypothetical protein